MAHTSLFFLCILLARYFPYTHTQDDSISTALSNACDEFSGNGFCQAYANVEECRFDGGDCCECTCVDISGDAWDDQDYACRDTTTECFDPFLTCPGDSNLIGDGVCDETINTRLCGYDGGDCCPCTCSDCSDVDCLNPGASQQLYDCEGAPSGFPLCVGGVQFLIVENTAQARALADAMNCSGGVFHVSWKGNVVVDKPIWVFNGTVLNVTGVGLNAEMDGNGSIRLWTVIDASLHMSSMKVSNGNATGGGAIAAPGSTLIVKHTVFAGNVASKDGGAIFASEGSVLLFDGAIEFFDNNASSGGALHITAMSKASWAGGTTFTGNVGGALSVRNGSMASWEAEVTFSGQVGEAALEVHGGSVVR